MGPFPAYDTTKHLLSTVDARVKLLAAVAMLSMVLSCRGFAFPALITLFSFLLILKMRISPRVLVLRMAEPLFIAAVVLVLKFFFSGQDALFSINLFGAKVIGHRDGLREGLIIGARMVSAVSIVAVLGFSTPFTEFMAGLSWFRVPKGFIEILLFAYRYIFMLFEDAQVIYQSQKNRLGYSTVGRGLSSFGTLAGSLTIRAFDQSQSTTVAMVQRGYDGTIPMLMNKPFRSSDIVLTALVLFVTGVLWRM